MTKRQRHEAKRQQLLKQIRKLLGVKRIHRKRLPVRTPEPWECWA